MAASLVRLMHEVKLLLGLIIVSPGFKLQVVILHKDPMFLRIRVAQTLVTPLWCILVDTYRANSAYDREARLPVPSRGLRVFYRAPACLPHAALFVHAAFDSTDRKSLSP